ncbi:unnamed protein product [Rotaria sp. Silwood2]|nr:unnamed protein product [Rotaria sp. Silwood2]CAF4198102.1 unnamed protein product [Rotaria sp. Silwood2]CAF4488404.1 unnamed protein product [Rotaria sp. Silwood2]
MNIRNSIIEIKKALLTGNGKINAANKYLETRQINVRRSATVLLNPEDIGSLTSMRVTDCNHKLAEYWSKEHSSIE